MNLSPFLCLPYKRSNATETSKSSAAEIFFIKSCPAGKWLRLRIVKKLSPIVKFLTTAL